MSCPIVLWNSSSLSHQFDEIPKLSFPFSAIFCSKGELLIIDQIPKSYKLEVKILIDDQLIPTWHNTHFIILMHFTTEHMCILILIAEHRENKSSSLLKR
jgi:hypothetical protein